MQKSKFLILSAVLLTSFTSMSCQKNQTTIMVVGIHSADDFNEIGMIIDTLKNKSEIVIDNLNFYSGQIDDKQVIVAQTPFGMSESAMTTTIGIKHFHPNYVINEGSAGGHTTDDRTDINDIILGKKILDMASYEGPGDDPSQWNLQLGPLHSDENLLKIASQVKYTHGEIREGTIATSDCWNTDVNFINKIHGKFGEDCEEMESYAVTRVCLNYNIPSLAIRAISNNAVKGQEYTPDASENCQRYTIDVIKAI